MRFVPRGAAAAALALAVVSCSDNTPVTPLSVESSLSSIAAATLPEVYISEIHYDNASTDTGEAIEITSPAGMDLSGWTVALYNGSNGTQYDADLLTGITPATAACTGSQVVVLSYPRDGVQNGGPDGIVLLDAGGAVVDALSYEGSFTTVGGLAPGTALADIGVSETGTTPIGHSLQRTSDGAWQRPAASTFDACNGEGGGGGEVTPGEDLVGTGSLLSEIRIDHPGDEDTDEYFELAGPAGSSLNGLTYLVIGDDDLGAAGTGVVEAAISLDGHGIGASGYFVAAESTFGLGQADLVTDLNFENADNFTHLVVRGFTGANGDDLDTNDDGLLELKPWAEVVDCVSMTTPAAGDRMYCRMKVGPDGGFVPGHIYRDNGSWRIGGFTLGTNDTPGAAPSAGGGGSGVSFSGRDSGDAPLPVGFEAQLFANVAGGPTTFTWSSVTPAIASVDQDGVVRALAAGTAVIRATSAQGQTGTVSIPTHVAVAGATAQYGGNTEFGEPTDADAGDDFIIRRDQFTSSYNRNRGTPNWASYNLDATHFGQEPRCNCFTADAELPGDFPRITTADYTGAGGFAGYGIDRGHLVRSFDREAGSLDNAVTYYFSNIVPQAADNNQGPWAILENYLGDRARVDGREVYIVAGVAGNKGTVKNEGKIVIPTEVWKVAVILPRDQGLDDVDSADDMEIIAVVMPNVAGIRNTPWTEYRTTVDAVEALSGYDLLALLPDVVERIAESGTHAPTAMAGGPYAGVEGSPISLSAAASSDPDGDDLTYEWRFPSGQIATDAALVASFEQDGSYEMRLVVTDVHGAADTTTATVNVANVAPTLAAFPGATILRGESFSTSGAFGDPGADAWTATVDYGDGSGPQALTLNGKNFSLSHSYASAGTFTVTVRVTDDDETGSRTSTVVVQTPTQGVESVRAMVDALVAAGQADAKGVRHIHLKLDVAEQQLQKGNEIPAVNQLESVIRDAEAMVQAGQLSAADGQALISITQRLIRSIAA